MRQHHTLGPAGAAAREEHDVRVALVECGSDDVVRARGVGRGGELLVRDRRHVPTLGELGVRGVDDEQTGLRVRDDVGGLGRAEARVDGRERGAELRGGREDRHDLERRLTPPGEAVVVGDAEAGQRVARAVGALVELGEGELGVRRSVAASAPGFTRAA